MDFVFLFIFRTCSCSSYCCPEQEPLKCTGCLSCIYYAQIGSINHLMPSLSKGSASWVRCPVFPTTNVRHLFWTVLTSVWWKLVINFSLSQENSVLLLLHYTHILDFTKEITKFCNKLVFLGSPKNNDGNFCMMSCIRKLYKMIKSVIFFLQTQEF